MDSPSVGAVGAAIEDSVRFYSVTDYLTAAVRAGRGQGMNRTLKTVESVGPSRHSDLKGFVILIPAGFTMSHCRTPFSRSFTAYYTLPVFSRSGLVTPIKRFQS